MFWERGKAGSRGKARSLVLVKYSRSRYNPEIELRLENHSGGRQSHRWLIRTKTARRLRIESRFEGSPQNVDSGILSIE